LKSPQPDHYDIAINPRGLSDVPVAEDKIGFAPYVRALAWFLSHPKTKAPLTLSIEGPWGSGKSSFMRQLEKELRTQKSSGFRRYYVRFNAWRNDKDVSLWASFAIALISQLQAQAPLSRRISGFFRLWWKRANWHRILTLLIWVVLTSFAADHLSTSEALPPSLKGLVSAFPWLASFIGAAIILSNILGALPALDFNSLFHDLHYEEKTAFIERFRKRPVQYHQKLR